jgi:hypothetical protein
MSATPPTDPKNPKGAAKQQLSGAVLWTVLALAFAIGLIYYGTTVDQEKKNFYFIAGGIAAVIAAVNGYSAWTLFQKSKQPPAAPK